MFGKLNARTLLIAAVALGLLWLLADRFSTGSQQRTFRSEVLVLDTAAVTHISIKPRINGHEEIVLERRGQDWTLIAKGREYRADNANVNRLLGDHRLLKADHMVGMIDAVKDRYELTDSLACFITFTAGGKQQALKIGKASYSQDGSGGAFTYVNVPGEKEVYAANGIINGLVESPVDGWRPKVLVTGDPANWQRLTFTYPADSGYVLERNGAEWIVDSMPADSGKVNKYLKSLALSRTQSFADSVDISALTPAYRLIVEDAARPTPIVVDVYPYGMGLVVTSTINPGNVMLFDAMREMPRLMRPRHKWFVELAGELPH